jgi:hypothetical protein
MKRFTLHWEEFFVLSEFLLYGLAFFLPKVNCAFRLSAGFLAIVCIFLSILKSRGKRITSSFQQNRFSWELKIACALFALLKANIDTLQNFHISITDICFVIVCIAISINALYCGCFDKNAGLFSLEQQKEGKTDAWGIDW